MGGWIQEEHEKSAKLLRQLSHRFYYPWANRLSELILSAATLSAVTTWPLLTKYYYNLSLYISITAIFYDLGIHLTVFVTDPLPAKFNV